MSNKQEETGLEQKKLICPNCGHIMARSGRGIVRSLGGCGCIRCGASGGIVVYSVIGNLLIPHWEVINGYSSNKP